MMRVGVSRRGVQKPTRVSTGCVACGQPVPERRRNGFCSDACRLAHQKSRRAELLEQLVLDDPGRAE